MKKKNAFVISSEVLIGLSAAFAILMLILFIFSGSIFPSGEEIEAEEQLGISLGYVLTGIVFTSVPSVVVFIALLVVDICLMAIKKKYKTLIACVVILSVFLPLFIISTLSYYMVAEYAKWLYAILIAGYLCYIAAIVMTSISLAKEKQDSSMQPVELTDAEARNMGM